MIIDSIKNIEIYDMPDKVLSICAQVNGILERQNGKYSLGDGIFVVVQRYNTVSNETRMMEAHKNYADLQYVASGKEQIGYASLRNQVPAIAYNEEKDIEMYDCNSALFPMEEGDFGLFFPQDLHKPGIGDGTEVQKLVIKIPIEMFMG